MAKVIRTERTRRGIFGTLVKWVFIAFNVLMLVLLVGHFAKTGQAVEQAAPGVDKWRAWVGGRIGTEVLVGAWLIGAAILGVLMWLTKGRKVVEEETVA